MVVESPWPVSTFVSAGSGRSFVFIDSMIVSKLLPLPAETKVLTGHGDSTTIGDEAPHLDEWIKRGY